MYFKSFSSFYNVLGLSMGEVTFLDFASGYEAEVVIIDFGFVPESKSLFHLGFVTS